jgi:peptide/nickel transport system ATP-binding protein
MLLRARKLTITPGRAEAPAIVDLDLDLEAGRFTAIVGPSGCGKSTLGRALVGLEPRMTGSLDCDGNELVGASPRQWNPVRRQVSLCWQDAGAALDPRATIRTSIARARALVGRTASRSRELEGQLARFRFPAELLDRRPAELSGGQRQRAALVRALTTEPRLLIADEVTSAVDRTLATEIRDALTTLPAAGVGVVMITHDLSLLTEAVDQVVVLDEGRVVECDRPDVILHRPRHTLTRALVAAIPRLRRPEPEVASSHEPQ